MTQHLSDIQHELIGTFFEEAVEALSQLETGLLALEHQPEQPDEIINDVFRAAHSIKGGAATFGLSGIAELAHSAETLLDRLRAGHLTATPAVTALLLESVDALNRLLQNARAGVSAADRESQELARRLDAAAAAGGQSAAENSAGPAAGSGGHGSGAVGASSGTTTWLIDFRPKPEMLETGNDALRLVRELSRLGALRVETDLSRIPPLLELAPTRNYLGFKLRLEGQVSRAQIDDVFSWVDSEAEIEIVEKTPAGAEKPGSARADLPPPAAREGAHVEREVGAASLRVSVGKLDMLMNMVGELVITQSILGELESDQPVDGRRLASLRDGLSLLARNTRALQESVMNLRSMPIGSVFARLPRLVHDLGRQLGKQVELKLSGQTTEVDKTVLEKLGDPLTHLVRNSLDHGIETPDVRRARGKPESGTLSVRAFHRGSDVVVEIEDDGGGLNLPKILARARERGLVAPDETPPDETIRELIFAPGFSTAEAVSDVSGRGVGMDVVRRNIKAIGGDVAIGTTFEQGTRITLRLPLTLAIIDGQLVAIGAFTYVVPLLSITESVQIDPSRVRRLEGQSDIYRLRDDLVPMVGLRSLLGVAEDERSAAPRLLVVVETDGERIGLLVDDLLAQQQVVVKSLETNYGHVEGLAGATILGDGSIALILDVVGLARLARRTRSVASAVTRAA